LPLLVISTQYLVFTIPLSTSTITSTVLCLDTSAAALFIKAAYEYSKRRSRPYRAQCGRSQEVGAVLHLGPRFKSVCAEPADQNDVFELRQRTSRYCPAGAAQRYEACQRDGLAQAASFLCVRRFRRRHRKDLSGLEAPEDTDRQRTGNPGGGG